MAGTGCDHLNEDGGFNLNEDGGIALLEGCVTTTTTTVGSGPKDDVHPETRRYWETERQRLRILRDDDEVLVML